MRWPPGRNQLKRRAKRGPCSGKGRWMMAKKATMAADWHQLLEICALFGTLNADLDGIYDPSQYNDRLLLGLKGTMSEAELHLLRQRMYQGPCRRRAGGHCASRSPLGMSTMRRGRWSMIRMNKFNTWCGSSFASLTNSTRGMRSYAISSSTIFSLGSTSGKALSRGHWYGADLT